VLVEYLVDTWFRGATDESLISVLFASFVGLYEVAAYCASKGAVASLTKALAIEWAKFGVCVNALVPGVFRTDLNAALLDGTERGKEFLLRTPMQ